MANIDAPFGMLPIRYRSGAKYNGACNAYCMLAAETDNAAIGDPVILAGATNTTTLGTHKAGTLQSVVLSDVASINQVGVIVGFDFTSTEYTYGVAATDRVIYVADDPDLVFEVQTSGANVAADAGLNASFLMTVASTTLGKSQVELDTTTKAVTATLPLRMLQIADKENNDLGTNAIWEVMINNHAYRTTLGA